MFISQKNMYALRAIFELAKHRGKGLIKISDIAQAQHIPLRFLEVILSQLKRSGLVESKRGYYGGYTLARSPEEIRVSDILHFDQKQADNGDCIACLSRGVCPFKDDCAFLPMWQKVHTAVMEIYDSTTISDLMRDRKEKEREKATLGDSSLNNR